MAEYEESEEDLTLYQIGYERACSDCQVLGKAPDFNPFQTLTDEWKGYQDGVYKMTKKVLIGG